ncbi:MAG: hypothetical protein FD156_1204 [Nitrospirae bacterium]|nr:MAG: hypothetical protein FD156_1204 [Nitrospirota bacterium]
MIRKIFIFCSVSLLLFCSAAAAAHLYPEKDYQRKWCAEHNGVTEHVLDDDARVDCLTDEYAIEFDFASKWAEAIGQSLYYAEKTGKKPGIVLILEKDGDKRHLRRLLKVSEKYHIRV